MTPAGGSRATLCPHPRLCHRGEDGARPVCGGDAGGDAARGFDGDGEGCAEGRGVVVHHQRQAELPEPVVGEGQADEAPAVGGHEVDGLGGHAIGGHAEVALVLAVLVVDEDDHLAGTEVVEDLGDWRQWHCASVGIRVNE